MSTKSKPVGPTPRKWHESYELLIAYKEKHGTTKIPRRYAEDTALAKWVGRQRTYEFKLSDEQKQKLRDIGFEFHTKDTNEVWNQKFTQLEAFKEEQGNCLVKAAHPELGEWVHAQRRAYQTSRLTMERQKKLESIGFVWKVKHYPSVRNSATDDKKWLVHFEKLKEYKAANGNCNVRIHYNDKKLANWVCNQRLNCRKGELRPKRKELLESLDFEFDPQGPEQGKPDQELWDGQFEKYLGHKNTSSAQSSDDEITKEVTSWINDQNDLFRNGDMQPARAERLIQSGFKPRAEAERSWKARYQKLPEMKKKKTVKENPELARWKALQKVLWQNKKLWKEREDRLRSLGLLIDSNEAKKRSRGPSEPPVSPRKLPRRTRTLRESQSSESTTAKV